MAMPAPLSGSAASCARTGISTPNTGEVTVLPKRAAYRSSSGCAISATTLGISSGRVVSTWTGLPSGLWNATRW